jgi:hypothetical protein
MHLKNCRSAERGAYAWKGTTLRVMLTSRPKVNVSPDGNTKEVYWWPAIIRNAKTYSKE